MNMRVLAVEDDIVVLMDIEDMLDALDLECLKAPSAEQALEIFGDGAKIDLVLVDLGLPGMSGADFVREIARRSPRTPIILCTGSDTSEHADLSDYDRLEKPFAAGQLAQALKRAVPTPAAMPIASS